MPGPKPSIDTESLLKILLDPDIDLYNNEELKTRSDGVWKQVCDAVGGLINPVNLHLTVKQDRKNILSMYRRMKGLDKDIVLEEKVKVDETKDHRSLEDEQKKVLEESEEKLFEESEEEVSERKPRKAKNSKKLEFDLQLAAEKWIQIKPEKKKYDNGREAEVLKPGWVDILITEIFKQEKLPCCYNVKRHCVGGPMEYISILGECKTCNARIDILCYEKPNDLEPANFRVITTNTRGIPHTDKRRLAGPHRVSVKQQLKTRTAKQWRRDGAAVEMNHGDPEPSTLYKLPCLRKARQEAKDEELGIKSGEKLFDSLSKLKNNVEFSKFMQQIGYDRFYVCYWSPEQISLYNDIQKALGNSVSLDATGSISTKINRPGGESSHIFLSVIVTHVGDMIIPVMQVLSEVNDTCLLTYCLNLWLKSKAKSPRFMVTDMGSAGRNSVSLAFNIMTFKAYNENCLKILLKVKSPVEICTQLQTDVAHLQHAVARWPCFTKNESKVKQFYLKCTGFMTTIETLEGFANFFLNVMVVAKSKRFDEACQDSHKYIIQILKTFSLEDDTTAKIEALNQRQLIEVFNDLNDPSIDADSNKKRAKKSLTERFIDKINGAADSHIGQYHTDDYEFQENDFYSVDFANRLCTLSYEFPSWTNVMNAHFKNPHKVAISARSETYFGSLKETLLEGKRALREDRLIVKHCRQIDSDMKLGRAALNNIHPDEIKKKTVQVENKDHLFASDRWRHQYCDILHDLSSSFIEDGDIQEEESNNSTAAFACSSKVDDDEEVAQVIGTFVKEFEPPVPELEPPPVHENRTPTYVIDPPATLEVPKTEKCVTSRTATDKQQDVHSKPGSELEVKLELEKPKAMMKPDVHVIDPTVAFEVSTIKECVTSRTAHKHQRGVHVRPDPELEVRLQKPKTRMKGKGIIKNGNKMSTKSVSGKRITFVNTCSWDSITELLSHSSCNIQEFRYYLEKNQNISRAAKYLCYASTLIQYSLSGVDNLLYTNRSHLLLEMFNEENGTVNCIGNLAKVFDELMQPYESITEISTCSVCGNVVTMKNQSIPIPNTKIVTQKKYSNLQEGLEKYFSDRNSYCDICKDSSAITHRELGSYLFIDTEDAYKKKLTRDNTNQTNSVTSTLNDLPPTVILRGEKFILCGAIEYDPPLDEKGTAHYIAYCRKLNGYWEVRNDLHQYKYDAKPFLDLQISAVFYVRCNANPNT